MDIESINRVTDKAMFLIGTVYCGVMASSIIWILILASEEARSGSLWVAVVYVITALIAAWAATEVYDITHKLR